MTETLVADTGCDLLALILFVLVGAGAEKFTKSQGAAVLRGHRTTWGRGDLASIGNRFQNRARQFIANLRRWFRDRSRSPEGPRGMKAQQLLEHGGHGGLEPTRESG